MKIKKKSAHNYTFKSTVFLWLTQIGLFICLVNESAYAEWINFINMKKKKVIINENLNSCGFVCV